MKVKDQTSKGKLIFYVLSYFKFSEAKKRRVCLRKENLVLDKASTEIFDVLKIEQGIQTVFRLNSPANMHIKGCTQTSLLTFPSPTIDTIHNV